jgi:hypothetical protein
LNFRQEYIGAARSGLCISSEVLSVISNALSICQSALVKRGFGEESLLAPLEGALRVKKNSGQVAQELVKGGGVAALMDKYLWQTDAGC